MRLRIVDILPLLISIFVPALALAQHETHAFEGRVLAQATPAPTQSGTGIVAMPGMSGGADMHAPLIFTLRSGIADGRMVYIGVGGDIDEKVNPTLTVHSGEMVQINLVNGEGAEHDVVLDQYAARSGRVIAKGASTSLVFMAEKIGEFA